MTACIVGWSHMPFGKHEDATSKSLIVEAAQGAIADAGLEPADDRRDLSRPLQRRLRRARTSPARWCCRPTGAALQARDPGRERLRHRLGRRPPGRSARSRPARRGIVLVVGVEKMTELAGRRDRRDPAASASYVKEEGEIEGGFAGVFGQIAQTLLPALRRPVRRAGRDRRQEPQERRRATPTPRCARTSASNSAAPSRRRTRSSPGPLKRTDCSLVSDGAAALVLADVETALRHAARPWRSAPRAQVNDFLPMSRRDIVAFEGCTRAWQQALAAGPARRSTTSTWSRPTTASPSPSCSNTRPWA